MAADSQRAEPRPISLIGAPTDIGAGRRGASMGPEALRVAGLLVSLKRMGYTVFDRGNIDGPLNPEAAPVEGYRHLPEVEIWCARVRDEVFDALDRGTTPVLLGGDHCLAIGSLAAVSRYCEERGRALTVLWLDAHADFNTPVSSPSGNIHGMPVAVATGNGPPTLVELGPKTPMVEPHQLIQVGIRSVDEIERNALADSQLTVFDMRRVDEIGMRAIMEQALSGVQSGNRHLHVSFDVDFLDPEIAPGVPTVVPGGPTYRESQLCMEMIFDSGCLGSLDIVELNPAFDLRNKTAELVVELVEGLFGEQTLSRTHEKEKYRL